MIVPRQSSAQTETLRIIDIRFIEKVMYYINSYIYNLNAQREYDVHKKDIGDIYLYKDKNIDKALAYYITNARTGDAYSQFRLAHCYNYGVGVIKNMKHAKKYYILAASQENAFAQVYLGHIYFSGIHPFSKNIDRAINLYTLAVSKKNAYAQYILGLCYYSGCGVSMNRFISMRLWELSAHSGLKDAQYYLATCYEKGGCGNKRCYNTSIFWYKRSAEQGFQLAIQRVSNYYNNESILYINKNKKKAFKYLSMSTFSNDDHSECML